MNPISAAGVLNNFLYNGYEQGIFRHVNTHLVTEGAGRLYSVAPAIEIGMIDTQNLNIDEYIRIISEERYSAILSDYSLLSLEWEIKGAEINRHRYMYIPCPIKADTIQERPPEIEIADFFTQLDRASLSKNLISQGYLRFDYTKDIVKKEIIHPIAHMTMISPDCRVALRAPLSAADFLNFIFDNFYPQYSNTWLDYQPQLRAICEDTIRPDEMSRMHMYWADEY
ncbi:DUF2290 domain-containing protein [Marinobacter sp.]|uniref:DUF2290 domain-containing protein n=1 Tax=Marinobacter sp. TaxID=50741 RepID=UPI003A90CFA7